MTRRPPNEVRGARYRKKPVVIEARKLGAYEDAAYLRDWIKECGGNAYIPKDNAVGELVVHSLEGHMYAALGDWIIKGIKGEFYPCKPDIFEATYEAVE